MPGSLPGFFHAMRYIFLQGPFVLSGPAVRAIPAGQSPILPLVALLVPALVSLEAVPFFTIPGGVPVDGPVVVVLTESCAHVVACHEPEEREKWGLFRYFAGSGFVPAPLIAMLCAWATRKRMMKASIISLALCCAVLSAASAQPAKVYDNDIVDAYEYMLGRLLVLRQETIDLKNGFKWNQIVHREPDGADRAMPNFNVVTSEAWIGVDETSCTLVEIPQIKERYYTLQVVNGWGEVTANINDRTYPKHPFGRFALCLKDANVVLPKDPPPPRAARVAKGAQPKAVPPLKPAQPPILRVNLPNRKSRVVLQIDRGEDVAEAVALQKRVTMSTTGSPRIDNAVVEPVFTNAKLPGVEAFDKVNEILASEDDINNGVSAVQGEARVVAAAIADPAERTRIDDVIRRRAIPYFLNAVAKSGRMVNGWTRARASGNYRTDYEMRSIANFSALWTNTGREMVTYVMSDVDGSRAFTQTYPADALPDAKARYSWSVVVLDGTDRRVIQNPGKRYAITDQSELQSGSDGSLALVFAPRLPPGVPESNWVPTPQGKRHMIVYRFYGPPKDVSDGGYAPPPLVRRR
jgi:hypothetical protein